VLISTYLDYAELERRSMRLSRLVLEMEGMDKIDILAISEVIFGNPFSKQLNVVVDGEDSMISGQLLVNLIAVSFVNSNGSCLCLIVNVSFLDQIRNDVVDVAVLGHEKIVLLLEIPLETTAKSGIDGKYLFSNSLT
jgi:hypothetical protein